MLRTLRPTNQHGMSVIEDPPIARLLFQSTGPVTVMWLLVRVFAAYQWLSAGWEKLHTAAWMDGSGAGILSFWQRAVAVPATGNPAITYDWYRGLLQFMINANMAPWFSKVIVFGELAVGLGLLFGAFVGIAAAGGLVMNMAFLLAGSTSTNPVLAIIEILLILAWKNAGYIGLDRYLLPAVGTPWRQSRLPESRVRKIHAAA